jgi:hypothetical protein
VIPASRFVDLPVVGEAAHDQGRPPVATEVFRMLTVRDGLLVDEGALPQRAEFLCGNVIGILNEPPASRRRERAAVAGGNPNRPGRGRSSGVHTP